VLTFRDFQPTHAGLADRIGELQRRNAGEIRGEAVDHEVNLHLAGPGHVVVLFLHARLQFGNGMPDVLVGGLLQLLLHLPDKGGMLFQETSILGTDERFDFAQL
jgi:hypothetical protein